MSEYDGGIELQETDGYADYSGHDGYDGYQGHESWPGLGLELPTMSELSLGDHTFGTLGYGEPGWDAAGHEPGWEASEHEPGWEASEHEPGWEASEHGSGWDGAHDSPPGDLHARDAGEPSDVSGADPVIVN